MKLSFGYKLILGLLSWALLQTFAHAVTMGLSENAERSAPSDRIGSGDRLLGLSSGGSSLMWRGNLTERWFV